jgi:hypothetical protein
MFFENDKLETCLETKIKSSYCQNLSRKSQLEEKKKKKNVGTSSKP